MQVLKILCLMASEHGLGPMGQSSLGWPSVSTVGLLSGLLFSRPWGPCCNWTCIASTVLSTTCEEALPCKSHLMAFNSYFRRCLCDRVFHRKERFPGPPSCCLVQQQNQRGISHFMRFFIARADPVFLPPYVGNAEPQKWKPCTNAPLAFKREETSLLILGDLTVQ